ncbi:MAG: FAD-dependent oxidoreductase [Actinomycetota bacterium]
MAFVITRSCCSDALCASVCPADCIHPTPAEPDFGHTEMLYIDPRRCIDCAACAEVCPVDAIYATDELPSTESGYAALNAEYYLARPPTVTLPAPAALKRTTQPLAVAVVGAGPSGFYAAAELLEAGPHVTVSLIDRLPTPYGLVRAGVAPDHQDTKKITETFAGLLAHPRLTAYFNVEVGADISHQDLADHHDAVIYATGAAVGRRLGVPGEDLPGSFTAAEFVGWYNGHPDHTDAVVTPGHPTAVLVGNGNVALDVARILLLGEQMGHTDIADHALERLRSNEIRDVVVLGRRGPEHAAFSLSQLLALTDLQGVDVVVDPAELENAVVPADGAYSAAFASHAKLALLREVSTQVPRQDRRIHFRFTSSVCAVTGVDRVEGVDISSATHGESHVAAGLVVSCIGFAGRAVVGIPFDAETACIPHAGGRVLDAAGQVVSGQYVTGWIKRGPSGVIGTNKLCAIETVTALLDDHRHGLLRPPTHPSSAFADSVHHHSIDRRGWLRIDEHERDRGRQSGRPRRKSVHRPELVELAHPQRRSP